jgi:hypothetical protein
MSIQMHPIQSLEKYPFPVLKKAKDVAKNTWRWGIRVLNKHTDLISSGGILAITTCLLAAKVFKSIPSMLPRLALVVFNFGGIIWLNVQVRDFVKSCRDFSMVVADREWNVLAETAVKVFVKGVNILLTCGIFAASVVAAIGFPQSTAVMYVAMRPVALANLALTIGGDIRDYFVNEALLKDLKDAENSLQASSIIAKTMLCFLEIIGQQKEKKMQVEMNKEKRLAGALIRQLDLFTLETFRESLSQKKDRQHARMEACKLFYAVQDSVHNKQASTKANLSLWGYARHFLTRLSNGQRVGACLCYTQTNSSVKSFFKRI